MYNWAAISAIVAIIGICWTIYAFLIKKRKKIIIELATEGRRSDQPKIHIILQNNSAAQITIVRILIRERGKDLIELSTQDFNLPRTIPNQQHIYLESPYLAHNIEKIIEIYAEDALGKKWNVSKKSLRQSAKILRNYIGHRLIYPSMGDVLDEKKLK
jgi:hypothetical protein